ncbi:hypothetical protein GCM10010885_17760 [Alicyclobacillus cellulosilyticus]|uniref:Uncharacterized protein n=1 Tax=Alicyclobacillus cellulosilyticus TaxID=1003997 RepID=A0A917KCF4_9BACL|nr:hypothetical protein GCM10010885_17760 [Alicyclobacillus cellulosilyticus]
MKFDTVLKLGSLAISVAQDEKVRALVKMAHQGAKRRGLLHPGPPIIPQVFPAHPAPYSSHAAAPWALGQRPHKP